MTAQAGTGMAGWLAAADALMRAVVVISPVAVAPAVTVVVAAAGRRC